MNNSEQAFEAVKRLLKLKRHEVPPPGYFHQFSASVISRIRAGEATGPQTFSERLQLTAPWLAKLMHLLEIKPGLVGACATGLCLLLVLGAVVTEQTDVASPDLLTANGSATTTASLSPNIASPLAAVGEPSGIVADPNPVTSLQPVATLFGQPNSPLFPAPAQPASFTSPGSGN